MRSFIHPLNLSLLLPTFSLTAGVTSGPTLVAAAAAATGTKDCHGRVCHPVEEFCSVFIEGCDKCSSICDANSHNFHVDTCARECADYNKYDPLTAEIHAIQTQQSLILLLLIVLLALIAMRYAIKCIRWLHRKRCLTHMLKILQPNRKKQAAAQSQNGKEDLRGTTIRNVMTINEMERAPSQIYSVTGAEGSVMTMTTPVSTRYPAENSTNTTPTTLPTEYSYDNQALAVTPVSEKPHGTQAF